ncbi:MAG: hypothetical protein QOJ40_1256 [Verrucomicrobiota bacterium]
MNTLSQHVTMSPAQSIAVHSILDRWLPLLVLTLVINLGSGFMFPNFVTDAFSWPAFLWCVPPVAWGAYLLFRYRSRGERWVSYTALLGALCWLLPIIGMVVEFGHR